MLDSKRGSVVVHNDAEFYLTVAQMKKPIVIKKINVETPLLVLGELECRGLIAPLGVENCCQCSQGEFLPAYPFIVEESA